MKYKMFVKKKSWPSDLYSIVADICWWWTRNSGPIKARHRLVSHSHELIFICRLGLNKACKGMLGKTHWCEWTVIMPPPLLLSFKSFLFCLYVHIWFHMGKIFYRALLQFQCIISIFPLIKRVLFSCAR